MPVLATVLLLTGGASRRLGRDKATAHVGGERLVDRLVGMLPPEMPVVVVGPRIDSLAREVAFAREDPPGSGPLAGIGAGLERVRTPLVAVLAVDMPFGVPVVAAALQVLVAGLDHGGVGGDDDRLVRIHEEDAAAGGVSRAVDAVVPVDPEGWPQPLCAAYRTESLRAAIARLAPLAGRAVRDLLLELRVMEWPVPAGPLVDVDTDARLAAARARAEEEGIAMREWVDAVLEALALDVVCDIDAILDVAREAAHAVERPAAPVTAYLLGAAVARGADPGETAAQLQELAKGWQAQVAR